MKNLVVTLLALVLFAGAEPALAQEIVVNRENRTIAVTVTESVKVESEVARIRVGYRNYGRTQDLTYQDNVQTSNRITQALLDAGVPKDKIETEKLNLGAAFDSDWPREIQKERQYEAFQSWTVQIRVADAQKVVDVAVSAGANDVEDVDWDVADPVALEAKANAAALAKARALAQQMATELGGKLGSLLYASNRTPVPAAFRGLLASESAMVASTSVERKPVLKLFPQKVERQATVYAVFALE